MDGEIGINQRISVRNLGGQLIIAGRVAGIERREDNSPVAFIIQLSDGQTCRVQAEALSAVNVQIHQPN